MALTLMTTMIAIVQRYDIQRSFCQEPFKVATACLAAICLILLMILVATSIHSKGSFAAQDSAGQDSPSSSAEAQMQKACANVTDMTAELQKLKKEKKELEEERSQLRFKIAELEAIPTPRTSPAQVTAKNSCPAGWEHFKSSCYFISVYSMSWLESQSYCKKKGGHLAIIHTAEEQSFIWNLLPRGHWNAYWIGVSDKKAEGDWYWVDGTKLVGGFWEEGEPNNHIDEDCGYMVKTEVLSRVATKSWYDAPCFMPWPWICEKEVTGSS
ncbi:C-type lectin domain family 4 member E-like isoform X2 [Myxocyprinus asiaticus]|uniref:C-type lectin domain family 4 member E-like isoform X2 n=1 Tax=Myxocyprinus asiaticus TaxID=70543 RepID=UPI0022230FB3|nr:C-type lectin domain family 4 member E-like isoform X2 [Myxocyprinus asiaticus]